MSRVSQPLAEVRTDTADACHNPSSSIVVQSHLEGSVARQPLEAQAIENEILVGDSREGRGAAGES